MAYLALLNNKTFTDVIHKYISIRRLIFMELTPLQLRFDYSIYKKNFVRFEFNAIFIYFTVIRLINTIF